MPLVYNKDFKSDYTSPDGKFTIIFDDDNKNEEVVEEEEEEQDN